MAERGQWLAGANAGDKAIFIRRFLSDPFAMIIASIGAMRPVDTLLPRSRVAMISGLAIGENISM